MLSKSNKSLIYLIIFFAGFSFLIYEVSWNRYLSLILGTTVTASTIVITAFMTGFGFGALILGKLANKSKNIGRLLSFILGGIGIMSIVNLLIIGVLTKLLYGVFSNHFVADILFFVLSFILLMIPAFFMGGIIPLVSKIVISENRNITTKLGNIYAYETLGSAIGGLITGFILLGSIGQIGTILIAIFINLLMAVYLFISKKYKNISVNPDNRNTKNKIQGNSDKSGKIALLSTLIIGFTILSLQIVWIRIFKTYFTNTSYTFTLITAFVILGLFIGSRIYKKRGRNIKNNDISMLKAVVLIVILSVLGLIILNKLPELLMYPFTEITGNAYVRLLLVPFIASSLIVLPPAIVSGFTFPLACNMYSGGASNISKNVGRVLMFNTIGSVIGPLTATFILIPTIGAGKSILIILILLSVFSIYISYIIKSQKNISKIRNVIIGLTSIIFLFTLFSEKIRFVPPSIKRFEKKIISYNETIEGTLVVVNEKEKGVFGKSTFVNNSSVIGSNYDAIKAVKMVGHIPFFSAIKCEKVLVIGFGIGVTTSAIASHSEVKTIDCVELVPGLVKSANHYQEFNYGIYKDKRLNMIPGDGRHFLQMTANKYDLISCDPTHPVLGSGNLYTQEYFQQVHEHLNTGGIVSQYLPLHKLRLEDLLGVIKTFHSVFENSTVWLGQYHAILLGRKDMGKIDFNIWKNKVNQMPKDDFFYLEPYHIAANIIFDSKKIENFPADIKINTDNLSYTEFFSFNSFNESNLYENLKYFSENRCNISDVFKNVSNEQKMNKFVNGNIKLTESIYYSLKGDKKNALNYLREATIINPEDQEFPFLIKFLYNVEK